MGTCVNHPERQAVMVATPFPGVSYALCQECGTVRFPICNNAEHAALERRAQAAEAERDSIQHKEIVAAQVELNAMRDRAEAAEADADRKSQVISDVLYFLHLSARLVDHDIAQAIEQYMSGEVSNVRETAEASMKARNEAQHAEAVAQRGKGAVRARGETA